MRHMPIARCRSPPRWAAPGRPPAPTSRPRRRRRHPGRFALAGAPGRRVRQRREDHPPWPTARSPRPAVVLMIPRAATAEEDARQTWLADLMGRSLSEGNAQPEPRRSSREARRGRWVGDPGGRRGGPIRRPITLEVLSEVRAAARESRLVADVARNPAFPARPDGHAGPVRSGAPAGGAADPAPGRLAPRAVHRRALPRSTRTAGPMPTEALPQELQTVDQVPPRFHARPTSALRALPPCFVAGPVRRRRGAQGRGRRRAPRRLGRGAPSTRRSGSRPPRAGPRVPRGRPAGPPCSRR